MERTFWVLAWSSFKRVQGAILTGLGVVVTVLVWIFKPETTIPMRVALPIFAVFAVIITSLIDAVFQSLKLGTRLPHVLYVSKSGPTSVLTLLLEPSELFSHDAAVSFYHVGDGDFEELIGIGAVLNVQADNRIQVVMMRPVEGHEDIIQALHQNTGPTLKRIIVKPVANWRYLRELQGDPYGQ